MTKGELGPAPHRQLHQDAALCVLESLFSVLVRGVNSQHTTGKCYVRYQMPNDKAACMEKTKDGSDRQANADE